MKLLVLDDEKIAVDFMVEGVDWASCGITQVFTAYDTVEAKEILKKERVDLLLCDIEMPGMNGLEFLQWMRENGYDMPCIFLTCHAKFEYAQTALRLGSFDYLLKPVPYKQIEEKIRTLVEKVEGSRTEAKMKELGKNWIAGQVKELKEKEGSHRTPKQLAEDMTAFMTEHIADPELSVTVIARKFGYNSDYLTRIFQKEKGMTPGKYLVKLRMDTAALLLKENDNVMQVAEAVGYSDYSYFSKSFKNTYGVTPAVYCRQ